MKNQSRLRALVTLIVAVAILYFTIGGILCAVGWYDIKWYAIAGGIVGSIASTLGLISLSRPALQQSDLDAIEIDSLKKIAAASEDIEELEARRTTQQEQIATLEQQKREMEILVQRASLSLFLQEQHKHHSDRIAKAIKKSPSITQSLDELARIKEKIDALEAEIETDPNVELLRSVIDSAKSPARDDDRVDDVPHPFRAYVRLLRRVAETLAESMKLVIRP